MRSSSTQEWCPRKQLEVNDTLTFSNREWRSLPGGSRNQKKGKKRGRLTGRERSIFAGGSERNQCQKQGQSRGHRHQGGRRYSEGGGSRLETPKVVSSPGLSFWIRDPGTDRWVRAQYTLPARPLTLEWETLTWWRVTHLILLTFYFSTFLMIFFFIEKKKKQILSKNKFSLY